MKLAKIRRVVKKKKQMRVTSVKVVTIIRVKKRKTIFQKMTDIVCVQDWGSILLNFQKK